MREERSVMLKHDNGAVVAFRYGCSTHQKASKNKSKYKIMDEADRIDFGTPLVEKKSLNVVADAEAKPSEAVQEVAPKAEAKTEEKKEEPNVVVKDLTNGGYTGSANDAKPTKKSGPKTGKK